MSIQPILQKANLCIIQFNILGNTILKYMKQKMD